MTDENKLAVSDEDKLAAAVRKALEERDRERDRDREQEQESPVQRIARGYEESYARQERERAERKATGR